MKRDFTFSWALRCVLCSQKVRPIVPLETFLIIGWVGLNVWQSTWQRSTIGSHHPGSTTPPTARPDPAVLVPPGSRLPCHPGCWPGQALWWGHTSWLLSRGYRLLLSITHPRLDSSQLASAACLGPDLLGASQCSVWWSGHQMSAPLSDEMFVPWALLTAEKVRSYLLRCTKLDQYILWYLQWEHITIKGPTLFVLVHPYLLYALCM